MIDMKSLPTETDFIYLYLMSQESFILQYSLIILYITRGGFDICIHSNSFEEEEEDACLEQRPMNFFLRN